MDSRVPPQSAEAEQHVLACCLSSAYALVQVADLLKPSDFYRQTNGRLFARLLKLHRQGKPVDLMSAREGLSEEELEGIGGFDYLVDLASSVPTTAHALYYAGLVADRALRREAILACHASIEKLHDLEVEDPVTVVQGAIMGVDTRASGQVVKHFGTLVEEAFEPIRQRAMDPLGSRVDRSVETGLHDLDQIAWIERNDLIVLGARPSCGKTAIALQVMLHAAQAGRRVLFFSLEMSAEAMVKRYYSLKTGIGSHRIRSGSVSQSELGKMADAIAKAVTLPFFIDDRPALTVAQIAATCEREEATHDEKLGLIVIDHMLKVQPASPNPGRRHTEMTQICGDLKRLNRRLGVPVLALYQLNRGSEKDNREPGMADLRESGSIEEDADHIWLLHRPDREAKFSDTKLIVAKNRNGACGHVDMVFDAARTQFACAAFSGAVAS